ncbi:MAG: short-chain dehydrogenase, partial [Spirochaetes bacterium]
MKRVEGKIAWISGATSGIGEAAAKLFAKEGARVAIVGRNRVRADTINRDIQSSGGESMVSICDVSVP